MPYWPIFGAFPYAINDQFVLEVKYPSPPRIVKNYITSDGKPIFKKGEQERSYLVCSRSFF